MYYHHLENLLLHAVQIITTFLSIHIIFDILILINVSYLSNDFPDKPTFTITALKETWHIMCRQQVFSNYFFFYLFYIPATLRCLDNTTGVTASSTHMQVHLFPHSTPNGSVCASVMFSISRIFSGRNPKGWFLDSSLTTAFPFYLIN